MRVDTFGTTPEGVPVRRLVLGSPPGPVLHLLDLGATVHRLEVTGGDGRRRNVVLGHPTPADYLRSGDYLGGTIGRYANRIAHGRFSLDGTDVQLATHDRGHHLHGGPDGFDRRTWDVAELADDRAVLVLVSPDGDMGFPGTLQATVRFEVLADLVRIGFEATTDAPTLANLTSHAYFNLDGEGAGTVDGHDLLVEADRYTPTDHDGIPLGAHDHVDGTPFDFRRARPIGAAVRSDHEQVVRARGVDHNFVLRGTGLRTAALLSSARTRTRLELRTDQPGLQVYTGNFLDGSGQPSTGGGRYRQGDGIALEPQLFPDTPNHPDFPSAVLRPGETYRSTLELRFSELPGRP